MVYEFSDDGVGLFLGELPFECKSLLFRFSNVIYILQFYNEEVIYYINIQRKLPWTCKIRISDYLIFTDQSVSGIVSLKNYKFAMTEDVIRCQCRMKMLPYEFAPLVYKKKSRIIWSTLFKVLD